METTVADDDCLSQKEVHVTRKASCSRTTKETKVDSSVELDGSGRVDASTRVPFFDHMLEQLGRHSGISLEIRASGDLEVDTHHTIEDVGIVLGQTLKTALADKKGVRRFASVTVPLDEAAVSVVLDLSGRPYLHYEIDYPGHPIFGSPPLDPQLLEEFWRAFTMNAAVTLHLVKLRGSNTHHIVEATFKGVAQALRDAVHIESEVLPSTKGTL